MEQSQAILDIPNEFCFYLFKDFSNHVYASRFSQTHFDPQLAIGKIELPKLAFNHTVLITDCIYRPSALALILQAYKGYEDVTKWLNEAGAQGDCHVVLLPSSALLETKEIETAAANTMVLVEAEPQLQDAGEQQVALHFSPQKCNVCSIYIYRLSSVCKLNAIRQDGTVNLDIIGEHVDRLEIYHDFTDLENKSGVFLTKCSGLFHNDASTTFDNMYFSYLKKYYHQSHSHDKTLPSGRLQQCEESGGVSPHESAFLFFLKAVQKFLSDWAKSSLSHIVFVVKK